MTEGSYKQFCPVAMASEILCTRWTMVLLRELVAGSTRFNDLRRGMPRMSPALLSKRLKDLEEAGLIVRVASQREAGAFEYQLTRAGRDARAVVDAVGNWGQTWVEARLSLKNLDPSLLMWDMRRHLDPTPLPKRRCVIQFLYPELSAGRRNWWLLVDPAGNIDLCAVDPGFEVDLYVSTDLRTMTEIWLGFLSVTQATSDNRMNLTGDAQLANNMQVWLGLSPFAAGRKLATAR
jgi:DNA-binding HxlR family transcriptional regulator